MLSCWGWGHWNGGLLQLSANFPFLKLDYQSRVYYLSTYLNDASSFEPSQFIQVKLSQASQSSQAEPSKSSQVNSRQAVGKGIELLHTLSS